MTRKIPAGRNLGRMAEIDFQHWCAEVRANAEKTAQDEIGVDFFVTSFWRPDTGISLDKQAPAFTCAVQVKGTDARDPSVPLSLQTWHHLVKSKLPAFVMLIHYAGKSKPQRAYLIHIGKVWGEKALKRLRKLSPKDYARLNKLRMKIRADAADELASMDGECVQERLASVISELDKYIDDKAHWVRTVGYTSNSVSFTVQATEDRIRELVDFAIGLRPDMPVTITNIDETRFGIKKPLEGKPSSESKITTPGIPSTGRAIITFRSPHVEHPAQVHCEFFHPNSVFGFIPKKYLRYRFRSVFFDFIFDPNTGAFSTAVDFGEIVSRRLPLQNWLVFFRLLRIQRMGDLTVSLEFDGEFVEIGASADATAYPPELDEVGDAIEKAVKIAASFSCSPDDPVSPAQIQAQRQRIHELYTILHLTPDQITVRLPASPEFINSASLIGEVYINHALVGSRLFLVVYVVYGTLVDTGEPAGNGMQWAQLVPQIHYAKRHTQLVKPDSKIDHEKWRVEAMQWASSQHISLFSEGSQKAKRLAKRGTKRAPPKRR